MTVEHASATDVLLSSPPFDTSEIGRERFLASLRETASLHYDANAVFRRFWQAYKLRPEDIRTEDDLEKIPPMLVTLFKEHQWSTLPPERAALCLKSSGTGGQRSHMVLSQRALERVKNLAYRVHAALGMTSNTPTQYLCFSYDPAIANDLGTAFTDELLTQFTPRAAVHYALQWNEHAQDFVFDLEATADALIAFSKTGLPTRLLGFPAFMLDVLNAFPNLTLNLGNASWVQTGGGWKGRQDEAISKAAFRVRMAERLGVPPDHVRDLFGMVEHGVPYVDCSHGRLHIPNYARVLVREPRQLAPCAEGERGLLQFICTYNDSMPNLSVLTTDWGKLGRCDCGLPGQTLELFGRAGINKHKGCALTALEQVRAPSSSTKRT